MTKVLEGFTVNEESTILIALKNELLRYKELVEQDDYWLYRGEIATLYRIFEKMGYDRQEVENYISKN